MSLDRYLNVAGENGERLLNYKQEVRKITWFVLF